MKKAFSVLLIIAMLFSTVGITIANHYCKIKKAEVEIQQCCKNKCDSDCCSIEFKVYKLSYDSFPASFTKYINFLFVNLISPLFYTVFSINMVEEKIFFLIKPPPRIHTFESSYTKIFLI